jgi:hypothetical protein
MTMADKPLLHTDSCDELARGEKRFASEEDARWTVPNDDWVHRCKCGDYYVTRPGEAPRFPVR